MGLEFICANECTAGGPGVTLKPPTMIRPTSPDGNCLLRALLYALTGCDSQHEQVRHKVVNHLTTEKCWRLLENYTPLDDMFEEYVQRMCMHRDGVWGTTVEILAFSHLIGLNIASYNAEDGTYHFFGAAVIDPEEFTEDNSRPGVYLSFVKSSHNTSIVSLPGRWRGGVRG